MEGLWCLGEAPCPPPSSLWEMHGVRTEPVTWLLVCEIQQHLLCSPAATPQGHWSGSNHSSADVDFGESLTPGGTKKNRYLERELSLFVLFLWVL